MKKEYLANRGRVPHAHIGEFTRKVDRRGQEYLIYPDGQMRRIAPNGVPLPRLKMSKKERLKLRKHYNEIKDMNSKELADNILATSVSNQPDKTDSKSVEITEDESKSEVGSA
jgi:hypothetical protein